MESEIGQGLQVSLLFPCALSFLLDGKELIALGIGVTTGSNSKSTLAQIGITEDELNNRRLGVFGAPLLAGANRVPLSPRFDLGFACFSTMIMAVDNLSIVLIHRVSEEQEVIWNLICDHRRSITRISLFEIGPQRWDNTLGYCLENVAISGWTVLIRMTSPHVTQTLFNAFTGGMGRLGFGSFYRGIKCIRTMSLSSATSDETALGGRLCSFLVQQLCFLIDVTLDLSR
ncbi:hypothetical protein Tco_1016199 [Tanacetum coccineum]|uniref:Uncharacterized protein n=1 Tax=Tanacetum coccineum TaxID=301880 RepID=A0ABQ5FNI0_9ASTR